MNISAPGPKPLTETTAANRDEDQKLRKACADFEAVLINYMLKSMRKTLPGDSMFGSSQQKEVYESMYDQEMAGKIAEGNGLGIGQALYRQLQKYEKAD